MSSDLADTILQLADLNDNQIPAAVEAAESAQQAAEQAAQQAAQQPSQSAGGKTEVSRQAYDDCDGSGHGYYEITYSDGSTAIEEY